MSPSISKQHKKMRVDFVKKCITMGAVWENVVFSNQKKKIQIDSPDEF